MSVTVESRIATLESTVQRLLAIVGQKPDTKKTLAIKIYNEEPDKSRAKVMRRFQDEVGLTYHGANTYYWHIKQQHKGWV